ncbi:unnamed protein product, partial [Durusdinium trenchii]
DGGVPSWLRCTLLQRLGLVWPLSGSLQVRDVLGLPTQGEGDLRRHQVEARQARVRDDRRRSGALLLAGGMCPNGCERFRVREDDHVFLQLPQLGLPMLCDRHTRRRRRKGCLERLCLRGDCGNPLTK